MTRHCPKCTSSDTLLLEEDGLSFWHCQKCGYDELEEAVVPEPRSTQREKTRHSPYKTGGKQRTR